MSHGSRFVTLLVFFAGSDDLRAVRGTGARSFAKVESCDGLWFIRQNARPRLTRPRLTCPRSVRPLPISFQYAAAELIRHDQNTPVSIWFLKINRGAADYGNGPRIVCDPCRTLLFSRISGRRVRGTSTAPPMPPETATSPAPPVFRGGMRSLGNAGHASYASRHASYADFHWDPFMFY